jgi:hypothetical protein
MLEKGHVMKKLFVAVLAVGLVAAAPGAFARHQLTAYDSKGKQASVRRPAKEQTKKAKTYGPSRRAYTTAEYRRVKAGTKKLYSQKISRCNTTYYVTKSTVAWIRAHQRARHNIVVRRWVAKGKYRTVCGATRKTGSTKKKS